MTKKRVINSLFVIMLALTPFFYTEANEDDSLYRYNALENKSSFLIAVSNPGDSSNLEEKLPPEEESEIQAIKELEDIDQKHNFSIKEINKSISSLKKSSKVKTFIIGNNLKILKFQIVQIREQVILLHSLLSKGSDSATKIQIENKIDLLEREQEKVENFISEQEKKFSLLGWLADIL